MQKQKSNFFQKLMGANIFTAKGSKIVLASILSTFFVIMAVCTSLVLFLRPGADADPGGDDDDPPPILENNLLYWGRAGTDTFSILWSGQGTQESPFLIATPQQFAGLQFIMSTDLYDIEVRPGLSFNEGFEDTYFELFNDIDLSAHTWVPLGITTERPFKGHLDGGGHRITLPDQMATGTTGDWGTNGITGLFANIEGSVKNLVLDGQISEFWTTPWPALRYDEELEENVFELLNVRPSHIGILAARATNATLENIVSYVTVQAGVSIREIGDLDIRVDSIGLVSTTTGSTYSGVINYGDISVFSRDTRTVWIDEEEFIEEPLLVSVHVGFGGLIGDLIVGENNTLIFNSANHGNLSVSGNVWGGVGGLVGRISTNLNSETATVGNVQITNSYNKGDINVVIPEWMEHDAVSGIIGLLPTTGTQAHAINVALNNVFNMGFVPTGVQIVSNALFNWEEDWGPAPAFWGSSVALNNVFGMSPNFFGNDEENLTISGSLTAVVDFSGNIGTWLSGGATQMPTLIQQLEWRRDTLTDANQFVILAHTESFPQFRTIDENLIDIILVMDADQPDIVIQAPHVSGINLAWIGILYQHAGFSYTENSTTVDFLTNSVLVTAASNMTLYLVQNPTNVFAVTLNFNCNILDITQGAVTTHVLSGEDFVGWDWIEPENGIRLRGYTIGGAGHVFEIGEPIPITGNTTLFAHFEWETPRTLTTRAGLTHGNVQTLTYWRPEQIIVPNPPAETGYTFVGWAIAPDTRNVIGSNTFLFTDTLELWAVYEWETPRTINLSFNTFIGVDDTFNVVDHPDLTFTYSQGGIDTNVFVPDLTLQGLRFLGWATTHLNAQLARDNPALIIFPWSEDGTFVTIENDHRTLFAVWEWIQYEVTFDTQGGTPIDSIWVEHGQGINPEEISTPTKIGYTFVQWLVENHLGQLVPFNFDMPDGAITGNITLVAEWSENEYTIRIFDVNNAINIWTINDVKHGTHLLLPIAVYNSFTNDNPFMILVLIDRATGQEFTFEADPILIGDDLFYRTIQVIAPQAVPPVSVVELRLSFRIINYSVTFNTTGGNSIDGQTIDHGGNVTRPADPTRPNNDTHRFEFVRWVILVDGNYVPFNFATFMVTHDLVIFAEWREIPRDHEYCGDPECPICYPEPGPCDCADPNCRECFPFPCGNCGLPHCRDCNPLPCGGCGECEDCDPSIDNPMGPLLIILGIVAALALVGFVLAFAFGGKEKKAKVTKPEVE
jgi:uncharacterized repeat protein (TIGR02543 family)